MSRELVELRNVVVLNVVILILLGNPHLLQPVLLKMILLVLGKRAIFQQSSICNLVDGSSIQTFKKYLLTCSGRAAGSPVFGDIGTTPRAS